MPRDALLRAPAADWKQNVVKYEESAPSRHPFSITYGGDPGTSECDERRDRRPPVNTNKNGKPAVMAGGKHDAYLQSWLFQIDISKVPSHIPSLRTRTLDVYHESTLSRFRTVKRYSHIYSSLL